MIRTEKFDEFFNRQPEREFIKTLKEPVHTYCPPSFGKGDLEPGEVDARGMFVTGDFPDPEGVLETAYADFSLFLEVYKIAGDRYPVRLSLGETRCFEAFAVEIAADGSISLRQAHDIAELVHDAVEQTLPQTKHCTVHVEPAEQP